MHFFDKMLSPWGTPASFVYWSVAWFVIARRRRLGNGDGARRATWLLVGGFLVVILLLAFALQ